MTYYICKKTGQAYKIEVYDAASSEVILTWGDLTVVTNSFELRDNYIEVKEI